VQLGHSDNRGCPHPHPGREKFVIITPNGFYSVAVDFCQCQRSGSQSHWEQLLSYGWYPTTPDNPQSAITIAALKLFHAVSLQGKTTAYHFFNALAKITDNTGSNAFKVCACPFFFTTLLMHLLVSVPASALGRTPMA
jgi:hypothetical protein